MIWLEVSIIDPVSYTHLDVYKRQTLQIVLQVYRMFQWNPAVMCVLTVWLDCARSRAHYVKAAVNYAVMCSFIVKA